MTTATYWTFSGSSSTWSSTTADEPRWSAPDPDRLHEFDVEIDRDRDLVLVRHRPTGALVELSPADWRPLLRLDPFGRPVIVAREAIRTAARRIVAEDQDRRALEARRRALTRVIARIDVLPSAGPDVELVERRSA